MKLNIKVTLFLVIISTITAGLCFAQSEVGHGGDAVLKNGKYYLLDLVEAGLETSGKLDSDYPYCTGGPDDSKDGVCHWYHGFDRYDALFGHDVFRGVLNAMTHLPDFDALSMLKTIGLFDWNFVAIPLIDIRDVNTPVDLSVYPIYQLAVRKDHTITINSLIWNQMDNLNRAALVTHEVLYALVRPIADPVHPGFQAQDSYAARQFNDKLYQSTPECETCDPHSHFKSPRLRKEFTNGEYTFTPYTTSFGNYGESDDFIGHDVNDGGNLVNKSYISTGAYLKLEGALQTNLVPGAPAETIKREKYVYFKDDAQAICGKLFANTGTFRVKASLVRTLFTLNLSSYSTSTGPSSVVQVTPAELRFSEWYDSALGRGKDTVVIETQDRVMCEETLKAAAAQFETLMHSAPDYIGIWDDSH